MPPVESHPFNIKIVQFKFIFKENKKCKIYGEKYNKFSFEYLMLTCQLKTILHYESIWIAPEADLEIKIWEQAVFLEREPRKRW